MPSASATRQDPARRASGQASAASLAAARRPGRTRAGRGVGPPGRRLAAAGREDRLVEPVGIDRVVDVVHRVEFLGPDRERRDAALGRDVAEVDAAERERRLRGPEDARSNSGGMRVGAPRASSRTQSMWTQATSAPSASWNSVRRRAQTRRQPTTSSCRPSSARYDDRGEDRDLGRPDQPGDAALGVPRPPEPAARGVYAGQVLGVAQQDRGPDRARPVRPSSNRTRNGAEQTVAGRSRATGRPARRASRS